MENPVLSLRVQRSSVLNQRAAEVLTNVRGATKRASLALSAVGLSHEHHSAFLRLMETTHFASAAAMLRPIAEASACAHWITYVAHREWISQASADSAWDTPTLDDMLRALARCGTQFEGIQGLIKLLQTAHWTRFHKYTHGGLLQLTRRDRAETFDQKENHWHLNLADTFHLAGAAIGGVWADDEALRGFVRVERRRLNDELATVFGGARVADAPDLPPTPHRDEAE